MRIIFECKTKVTKWSIRICGLCHLREEKMRISIELSGIYNIFEKFSNMRWLKSYFFCSYFFHYCIFSQYSLYNLCLFISRKTVNSREKRYSIVVTPLSNFFIGKNHKFFDELMSIVSLAFLDLSGCFCCFF